MIFIYVPFQNAETAKTVGKLLVEKRMAGSVDVLPTRSYYRVNGEVAETSGATIIVKTIDKHIQGVEDVVREYYQDGIPCIASLSLYRLNRDFKDWLINATN
jgi:uncharacterized protein involved in tolerance to divalent cations